MSQRVHPDVLRLVEVVAPAGWDRPIVVDWGRIHRELGLRFPSDYRQLMERFPSMLLQDLVEVWHPNEDLDPDGVVETGPTALGTIVAANSIRIDGHQLEWTPRSSTVPWGAKVEQMLETFRVFRRGSDFPFEFWPEPGGLVPWADVNGDLVFCWRTVGDDPDAWPVVIVDNGVNEWSEFDGTASDCLVELLEGTANLPILAYARDMFRARPIDVQLWE